MGRWVTGPASTLRRSACPRYSWTVRADSAWSSIGLEAALSTQSMEPWRNIGCCAIPESPHIQRETVQHRRAGRLHYVLATEASRSRRWSSRSMWHHCVAKLGRGRF